MIGAFASWMAGGLLLICCLSQAAMKSLVTQAAQVMIQCLGSRRIAQFFFRVADFKLMAPQDKELLLFFGVKHGFVRVDLCIL